MDDAQPKDDVEDPHAACQRQVADVEAKWKRALADYQNREKELAREREDFAKFCTVDLIRSLLPIVDAIEAGSRKPEALTIGPGQAGSPEAGFAAMSKLCSDFLKRHGVEPVGAVGDRVDYLLHEVVGTRAEEGKEAGTILEVAQIGYTMHGRLLRPARVIVVE
ncbi:nucleotide exchange factor GrpE [Candidatus Uhrbacteria bacterium]|nr:nucleotide exchange factor GrpE [Candidatus Uhrbacteria bacterium]